MALRYNEQMLGKLTMSAGIAGAPEHAFTARELMRAADDALYVGKQAGRDQVVVCESRSEWGLLDDPRKESVAEGDAAFPRD